MKNYILFVSVTVTILFSGCKFPGSSKNNDAPKALDKELHVYNWTNVLPDNVLKDFEAKFGVRIIYDNYFSNEELLAKIQTRTHDYDVIFPSDYMVDIMRKQNLLEKLDSQYIPNRTNIDPKFAGMFYDPNNEYSEAFQGSTVGIAVNLDMVKDFKASWEMLFDKNYKSRISMLDDMRYGIIPALVKLGYDINTTNPSELEKVKNLMIEQKSLVKAYSSDTYIDLIKSGEVWLACGYSIDILQIAHTNPKIQYVLPEEGSARAIESMCIPAGSKRKYTAEVFINYILTPEVHAKISNYSFATCPNKAAMAFINPDIKNNKSIYPDSLVLSRLHFLRDVGNSTKLYDNCWNEIKNH